MQMHICQRSIPNENAKYLAVVVVVLQNSHFTLLLCSGRQRNVQRSMARAQLLFYSLNLLFGDLLVAVVVCLSSLFMQGRDLKRRVLLFICRHGVKIERNRRELYFGNKKQMGADVSVSYHNSIITHV